MHEIISLKMMIVRLYIYVVILVI